MTESYAAQERERLILEHLPQVRWIAETIADRLPAGTPMDDLVSAGVLGLIAAVDNFDAAHNASLRTYAEYRIRGAILDSVRGLDGIPAHKRKRIRDVQGAIARVEQREKRNASDDEIAAELRVSMGEYHDLLLDLRAVTLGSLDVEAEDGDSVSLLHYLADEDAESPAEAVERAEMEERLAEAVAALPEQERIVLALYFTEELTLAEIGKVMSVHTSRVSQIKSQAILRLRNRLARKQR